MVTWGVARPPRDCVLWLVLVTIGRGLSLAVLLNTGALQSSLSASTVNCPEETFSCPDLDASTTQCLGSDQVCDGVADCGDGRDEADCDSYVCNPIKDFVCSNKKCITQHWVCDKANDCGDWSDEKDCPNKPHKDVCGKGEFQCKDHSCIPAEWFCDQSEDCPDKSDETDCSKQIKDICDQFLCRDNTECIPNRWRCDSKRDCKDGSDEDNCGIDVVRDCSPDKGWFACNDNCLNREKICDGVKHCFDGSDEGGLCGTDHCTDGLCSQNCFTLPTGPQCFCSSGYQLNQDNHTCSDVNECSTLGSCSQLCKNTIGSFSCSCGEGYTLDKNNRSCIAEGEDPLLLFSTQTEIRAYELRSRVYFPVQSYLSNVVGVSYDAENEWVYWSDGETGRETIFRSKLHESIDSSKEEIVTAGLEMPEDLQVDWIGRKLYFTDVLKKHIAVCELDGSVCSILLTEKVQKPRAIALDPTKGFMYWTDWGDSPYIGKAGMDGSQKTSLVEENMVWPSGLTLDYTTQRLYWSDSMLSIIETVKLDGTDRRKVLEGMVKSPFSIAVFEDALYWSDWKLMEIQSCNKFTGRDHQVLIKESGLVPRGIHIFHPVLWKEAYNPCSINFCSHMCVIAPQGRSKCVCPVGHVIGKDQRTCQRTFGKSLIAVSRGDQILELMPDMIGRNTLGHIPIHGILRIGALAYDPLSDSLIYSDMAKKEICMYNFQDQRKTVIVSSHIRSVEGLAMDYIGNNIYWTDISEGTVEVMNVANGKKVVLLEEFQRPLGIALIPEKGLMFISDAGDQPRIARLNMDGTNSTTLTDVLIVQPISLAYDYDLERLFWCDFIRGNIESISIEGKHRRVFLMHLGSPMSIMIKGNRIYWAGLHTSRLYSINKNTGKRTESFQIGVSGKNIFLKLASVDRDIQVPSNHTCSGNNGGCSHVCLVTPDGQVCSCPAGSSLDKTGLTCSTRSECTEHEFECSDGTCLPLRWRCDKQEDCSDGEDERKEICNETTTCQHNYFTCEDGTCIHSTWVCDNSEDCLDGSDEKDCLPITCDINEFRCADKKKCIPLLWHCDGSPECADKSDEENCPPVKCNDNEFTCRDGDCVPQAWTCDDNDDCADGSDEENCHRSYLCQNDEFQCLNGDCVDRQLMCDGNDDCADKSDEISCRNTRLEVYPCSANQFRCINQVDTCVPNSARCNGTSECLFGEDEDLCPCLKYQFACENGNCIAKSQKCDGVDDCGDRSDERNCHRLTTTTEGPSSLCREDEYWCKTGECVKLDKACDNREDCRDGSDEEGQCKTSCLTHNGGCSSTCKATPDGPRCQCQVGFISEKGLCLDVDECTQEGICSHYCNNTRGSFKCSCASGYRLEPDNRMCRALGEPPVLFYVDRNMILAASWSWGRMNVVDLVTEQQMGIAGMDFDFKKKEIYYISELLGTVSRVHINENRSRTVLKDLNNPSQIAVDWITGNIYITEHYTAVIKVCDPASSCTTLVNTKLKENSLTGLALEPRLGYLFWCGFSFGLDKHPHGTIMKMEMDGTRTVPLIKKDPSFKILEPSGIAVDFVLKQLFWADLKLKVIGRVNLDGTGKQIVIRKNDVQPFGLALFQDHLFFLAHREGHGTGFACGCNKFSRNCFYLNNSLSVGSHNPLIVHQSRQPPGKNPCNHEKCSHLCVIRPGGYRCLCPDGMVPLTPSAKKCKTKDITAAKGRMAAHPKSSPRSSMSDKTGNSLPTSNSEDKVKIHADGPIKVIKVPDSDQSSRTLVGVMVFFLFLALGIVTAVLYLKKFRKTKDGRAMRFHFHNPSFGLSGREVGASSASLNHEAKTPEVSELGLTRNSYSNPAFMDYSPVIQDNLTSGRLETFSSPITWPAPSLECDSAFVSQSSLTMPENSELMEEQLTPSYVYTTHEKDYLLH